MNSDEMPMRQFRFGSNSAFAYSPDYFAGTQDRNAPLAMSLATRPDPRPCPMGGRPGRINMGRDEPSPEPSQTRRRIAVACARCRKRKIRCSGDPGNGAGCQNCRSAGADISQCQFHRVGSSEVANVMASFNLANAVSDYRAGQNGMIPMYSNPGSIYPNARAYGPTQFPNINPRPPYTQTWPIAVAEETSPVAENFNMDQNLVSEQSAMPNLYTGWNQATQRPPLIGGVDYLQHDATALPYISTTGIRPAGANEAGVSPLSMTSLGSTLPISNPAKAHPKEIADGLRLPIPHPTRTSVSTNVADELQTRALPPTHMGNGLTTMSVNGDSSKTAMAWSSGAPGVETDTPIPETPIGVPETRKVYPGLMKNMGAVNGAVMSYTSAPTPPGPNPAPNSRPPINFSTSTLLDGMPASTTATYSNFRNYQLPTSSSTETVNLLSSESSQTSLYSYSTDSASKRSSLDDGAGHSTLVSGHSYSPLGNTTVPTTESYEPLRRDSFTAARNRTSLSSGGASF